MPKGRAGKADRVRARGHFKPVEKARQSNCNTVVHAFQVRNPRDCALIQIYVKATLAQRKRLRETQKSLLFQKFVVDFPKYYYTPPGEEDA